MFKRYSNDYLKELNTSDIVQVASSIGIELEDHVDNRGNQRAIGTNGKLTLNRTYNNMWDFERQSGGQALTLLTTWGGKTFPEAVTYLAEHDFSKTAHTAVLSTPKPIEPFVYDFQLASTPTKLRNYSQHERKIMPQLTEKLLQAHLIAQDNRGNILFHFKKGREIVGTAVQGTFITFDEQGKKKTFKQVAKNSEANFGFHFSFGEPTRLYAFEAPFDSLSYFTLNPQVRKNVMYGSMSGLKPETLKNFVQYAKSKGNPNIIRDGVFISTDNDFAGIKFWTRYAQANQSSKVQGIFHNNIPDFYSVPRDVLTLYQKSQRKYNDFFDLKPLLAVHKYETNFAFEKRLANDQGAFKFFGEKTRPHATKVTPQQLEASIDRFVATYIKNGKDLGKTIYNPDLSEEKNKSFLKMAEELGLDYEDRMLVRDRPEILKDWNDVLKDRTLQLANPQINVSNSTQLERSLESFDYNQIAKQDLKAVGITNREQAKVYKEENEIVLE